MKGYLTLTTAVHLKKRANIWLGIIQNFSTDTKYFLISLYSIYSLVYEEFTHAINYHSSDDKMTDLFHCKFDDANKLENIMT